MCALRREKNTAAKNTAQIQLALAAPCAFADDLIVVGGGPSGVAGALKGAYMGKRVLLVDKPKCVPPSGGLDPFFGGPTGLFSKALRDAAKTLDVGGLSAMGLDSDVIFKQVQNSCLRLARNNAEAQGQVLDKFKVDYLQAEATVNSIFNGRDVENEVRVTVRPHADPTQTSELVTSKLLLCTGSYPRRPPGIPFDGKQVFDSDSINAGLSFLPKSVVLVGSGIIAIEYAKIFRKLGAKVTMVVRGSAMAALDRIGLDETIAERLLTGLREEDVQVLEDTSIVSYDSLAPTGVDDYATDGVIHPMEFGLQRTSSKEDVGTIEADLYLACLGRVPRARGTSLGLEAAGVTLTEGGGHIFVDPMFETSQKNIYAAGDCIEGPALASTGVDQAQRAVSSMFGCSSDMCEAKDVPYPIGMWTIPEVGPLPPHPGARPTHALLPPPHPGARPPTASRRTPSHRIQAHALPPHPGARPPTASCAQCTLMLAASRVCCRWGTTASRSARRWRRATMPTWASPRTTRACVGASLLRTV
jgi:NAD(P) transhydrogenase